MVLGDGFILWRLFLPNQSSSALNSAFLTLRKRGVWPTIEAVKGCVLVLVRGCLGRVSVALRPFSRRGGDGYA